MVIGRLFSAGLLNRIYFIQLSRNNLKLSVTKLRMCRHGLLYLI